MRGATDQERRPRRRDEGADRRGNAVNGNHAPSTTLWCPRTPRHHHQPRGHHHPSPPAPPLVTHPHHGENVTDAKSRATRSMWSTPSHSLKQHKRINKKVNVTSVTLDYQLNDGTNGRPQKS